jgi:hypothetical protein
MYRALVAKHDLKRKCWRGRLKMEVSIEVDAKEIGFDMTDACGSGSVPVLNCF